MKIKIEKFKFQNSQRVGFFIGSEIEASLNKNPAPLRVFTAFHCTVFIFVPDADTSVVEKLIETC